MKKTKQNKTDNEMKKLCWNIFTLQNNHLNCRKVLELAPYLTMNCQGGLQVLSTCYRGLTTTVGAYRAEGKASSDVQINILW